MSEPRGDDRASSSPSFAWSASQRRILIILLFGILAYLGVRLWRNPMYVSDPQPPHPTRESELRDRIDPNTADWATLAALPTIGEKRAKEIIAYREKQRATDPSRVVFRCLEDLMQIKGVGSATISNLAPYLIFPSPTASPTAAPTSEPVSRD